MSNSQMETAIDQLSESVDKFERFDRLGIIPRQYKEDILVCVYRLYSLVEADCVEKTEED